MTMEPAERQAWHLARHLHRRHGWAEPLEGLLKTVKRLNQDHLAEHRQGKRLDHDETYLGTSDPSRIVTIMVDLDDGYAIKVKMGSERRYAVRSNFPKIMRLLQDTVTTLAVDAGVDVSGNLRGSA